MLALTQIDLGAVVADQSEAVLGARARTCGLHHTLRRYVDAPGGTLCVEVRVGKRTYQLA